MRVGVGYDAHRLVADRPLILGGVRIPYHVGLEGFSDADVLSHAVCDALLGAAALGDLGTHFPSSDEAWRGTCSLDLLRRVAAMLEPAGWRLLNLDAVIIAQAPKLAPYTAAMRRNVAEALGVALGQVGIKATSTDGLGFTGSGEGMAAHAVALLQARER
ncbi:MAG: 2-C-methyl-D-erythritol 2,4-cyclodiphosphate synthase [Candidatus Tectomicrobia bacterium]|nr:2-C-methyl-D-erythritol 2,4-cyclodiphosphate synthase [Candidatus Tectomicrobia bacterium]